MTVLSFLLMVWHLYGAVEIVKNMNLRWQAQILLYRQLYDQL